ISRSARRDRRKLNTALRTPRALCGQFERMGSDVGNAYEACARPPQTLATIPERVETPIFVIAIRRNCLIVFGLTRIDCATSLVVSPRSRYFTVSDSRGLRRYKRLTSDTSVGLDRRRSKTSAVTLGKMP